MPHITANGIRYEICDHCLQQMARRGVRKQNIQSCLNYHQVSCIFKEGYSLCIADHASGKRLQVVVNTKGKVIVSVVWLP
jgi:putative hemolysin